jgi:hypothetical protein
VVLNDSMERLFAHAVCLYHSVQVSASCKAAGRTAESERERGRERESINACLARRLALKHATQWRLGKRHSVYGRVAYRCVRHLYLRLCMYLVHQCVYAPTHMHSLSRARSLLRARSFTLSRSLSLSLSLTHSLSSRSRSLSFFLSLARALSLSLTHTHMRETACHGCGRLIRIEWLR